MKLTYEEKVLKYNKGDYHFKAPPVCTYYWTTDSWVKWIDSYNGWNNRSEADEISPEDLEAAGDHYDRLTGRKDDNR